MGSMFSSHGGHSADVRISLMFGGHSIPVAQLGPDFLLLDAPTDHPPGPASILLRVDQTGRLWDVRLHNGICATSKRVLIRGHASCSGSKVPLRSRKGAFGRWQRPNARAKQPYQCSSFGGAHAPSRVPTGAFAGRSRGWPQSPKGESWIPLLFSARARKTAREGACAPHSHCIVTAQARSRWRHARASRDSS